MADLTPIPITRQGLLHLRDRLGYFPKRILDPSAGAGVFGMVAREVWPDAVLIGVEKDPELAEIARPHYDAMHVGRLEEVGFPAQVSLDFRAFDLVTTNPPFDALPQTPQHASWVPRLLELAPVVWLYAKESVGIRIKGQEALFAAAAPTYAARVGGIVCHRGPGVGADSCAYVWWLWSRPGALRELAGWLGEAQAHLPPGMWVTTNLPTLPTADRRWITMPGASDNRPAHAPGCE